MAQQYDFTSPSTLPEDRIFVVRPGYSWMVIGRYFPLEFVDSRAAAVARANEVAKERGWTVEIIKSPGDDLPWNQ
jgi:hypothetical protein